MPMRAWTRSVRKCWRSAGPCSRRRWDWTMDSPRLAGTRSPSRAWRSNCKLQDGWCRSGRCSATATLHERWPAARGRSSRPPRPLRPRVKSDDNSAERDEAAAEVLSVGYFTTLQVLFALFLYSPGLVAFLVALAYRRNRDVLHDRQPLGVHHRRLLPVLAGPRHALRQPALGHDDQALHGWRHLQEQCDPGRVPQVEQNASAHLVHRTAGEHRCSSRWCDVSQRAAHGIRVAAARRDRGQQPSVRARCLPVRAAGLDLHRGRCRHPDRRLHPNDEVVGAVPARRPDSPRERLQDRDAGRHRQQCDGGPRHLDHSVHPHPQRRGFAGDVGRSSRAPQRPLHGAQAHGEHLPVRASDLATGDPQHPDAGLHILLAQCGPHRRDPVVRPRPHTRRRSRAFRRVFQGDAAVRDRLAPDPLRVHHHLGHHRRDLFAGLPLHPLHGRFAGAVPRRAGSGALSSCTE